LQLTINKGT